MKFQNTILFLLLLQLFFVCSVMIADDQKTHTEKPNVLFIITEDTHWNVFGCYGNTVCKTPNIDKLASSGVRFEHAYCQGSACNATRTSFINGLRPATTQLWKNPQRIRDVLPEGVVGMPELFKESGYTTIDIGKFYHNGNEFAPKQMLAFDRIEHFGKPEGWQGPEPILKFPNAKPDWNKKAKPRTNSEPQNEEQRKKLYSDSYGDSGLDQENEGDWRSAQIAVALLEQYAADKSTDKKPFFMTLGQARPHTPYISPTKFATLYDPEKIPDPPAPLASLKDFPYINRTTGGNPDIFRESPASPKEVKEAIAAYYGCVTFVDDNLGLVLNALEKTGLDKNTIVILIGDHGVHLGDHNMWAKYSLLEGTHRAPLIIRVPGAKENSKVSREIVEFVDILPTLIDFCGLRNPGNLEGISLKSLLQENVAAAWKKAAFLTDQDQGQAVRTKKYSYMEFGEPKRTAGFEAALFDLEKDPNETVNLINDPAYADVKKELAELLHQGWKSALPPHIAAQKTN
ncbi:MAG: sulfatase [Planctomycetaceae bacterium]|jgi:arylsulfatase A-like enzyme|nr:sulfatase [Planctomycetaceae bacterium]